MNRILENCRKHQDSQTEMSRGIFDGGRLAKLAGDVISMAPSRLFGRTTLMSVSSLALGSVIASTVFGGIGNAQCRVTNDDNDNATFKCSGTITSQTNIDLRSSLLSSGGSVVRNLRVELDATARFRVPHTDRNLRVINLKGLRSGITGTKRITLVQAPGGQDLEWTGSTNNFSRAVVSVYHYNTSSDADTYIHLTGNIKGSGRSHGISVSNKDGASYSIGSGDVTITAADIIMTGRGLTRSYGIAVREVGGNVTINLRDMRVSSTGIRAQTETSTGRVTISASNVFVHDAIAVSVSNSAGNITGTFGNVTSEASAAFSIFGGNSNSTNSSQSVSLTTKNVSAGSAAIIVNQNGSGNTSVNITVNGDVRTTGRGTYANDRNPGAHAIWAKANSGSITITVNGDVIGGTGSDNKGIVTSAPGAHTINVTGGVISAASDGINTNNASSKVTVNNVTLNSNIITGSGLDEITIAGTTTLASGVVIDGGEDAGETSASANTAKDLFTISNLSLTVSASDFTSKFKNFERLGIKDGAILTFPGSTITWDEIILDKGALSTQDGAADDALTVSGNVNTGGMFNIDVDFSSTTVRDTITISGNLTGTHKLFVADVTPVANSTRVAGPIEVVTVTGTVAESALSLGNDELISGNRIYTLSFVSSSKTFVLSGTVLTAPACTEDSNTAGTFVCNGTISGTQWLITTGATNNVVTLDDAASVSVTSSWAFRVRSQAGITFTQETGGAPINATGTAPGVLKAETTGSGNVSVTFINSITQTSSGTTLFVRSTGTGNVGLSVTEVTATNGTATAIHLEGAGGAVTLSANSVNGGSAAIIAKNMSTGGSVSINTSGDISSTAGHAINAYSQGSSITISTRGAVRGGKSGIIAANEGSGDGAVSIQTSAAVTGNNRDGIYAYNTANGDLTITANGTVTGKNYGIDARNYNSGAISITTTAQITGGTGTGKDGISALNRGTGGITIVARNVTGDDDGIDARNEDGGSVAVTANGDIRGRGTSRYDAAIFVNNDSYGENVTVTVAEGGGVTGAYGIYVENFGSGSVSVTASGNVVGTINEGIYVDNRGTSTDVEVKSVQGSGHGLDVRHEGSGTATINVGSGGVIRGGEKGIKVVADSSSNVAITSSGAITGTREQGIYASKEGSGNLSITTIATITGGKEGVDAELDGVGDLSITVAAVTGGEEGIKARKFEDGDLTIVATGAVTAGDDSGDDGVYAYADGVGDISVTVSSVTGDDDGLDIRHYGSGTLTVSATGEIVGNGSGDSDGGISSIGESNAGAMTFNLAETAEVEGYYGLLISRKGSGSIVINSRGSVEGTTSDGMDITADDSANIMITVAGDVTGAASKVAIDTYTETGSTTIIINSGTISAPNGPPPPSTPPSCIGNTCVTPVVPDNMGLAVRNNSGASTVTINSGATVTSGISLGGGVDVLTFSGGTPPSSVMLDGGTDAGNTQSVDKLHFNGVTASLNASHWKNWEEISIGTGSEISFVGGHNLMTKELKLAGILSLQNDKIGDEFFLSRGNLTGDGIIALDVDFSTGESDFINITDNMSGSFTLRVEDVSPSNTTRRVVHNTGNASPNTIVLDEPIILASVAGTVAADAISLEHSLVISRGYAYRLSYSSVYKAFVLTGKLGEFICRESVSVAGQFSCVGSIIVTENLVKSRSTAVVANLPSATTANVSTGVAFNIGGGGPITFVQEAGGGALSATVSATGVILARTIGNGTVTVTLTGDVSLAGSGSAILVDSMGTGNVAVTASKVVANHSSGTAIKVEGKGETVTVSAGEVSAGSMGIVAKNANTSGSVSVNTTGAISSNSGSAIYAYGKGTSVNVNTRSTVTASSMVVKAVNKGDGAVVVNTSVDVTSSNGKAIYAYGNGTAVTITTSGLVNASGTGIEARSKGSGTVGVTANDDITSSNGIAIHTYGLGSSVSVTTSADVTGRTTGIKAENRGSGTGSISIVAAGAVTATSGTAIDGFIASSGTLSISSEVVNGTTRGILAMASGEGNIEITASGNITADQNTGIGIDTGTSSGTTTITIEDGIIGGDKSIRNNAGASTVTIKTGATIVSNIELGGGSDVLNLNGGTFSADVIFDGGSDTGTETSVDAINFNAGNFLLTDVDFKNFERIGVGAGARIRFDGNHSQTIGEIRLSRGAIGLQDRVVGDNLVITGNLSSASTSNYGIIEIDVNFSSGTTDTVSVSGNLTGRHVIKIADVTPSALTTRTSNPITVITVTGTAEDGAVRMDDEKFSSGGYTYTVSFDERRKTYSLVGERGTLNCTLASDQVNFTCSGNIQFTENIGGADNRDVTVTLDSLATVSVDSQVAFRLTGSGNVSFAQERGGSDLTASGAATGVIEATTSGNGNVSISVTGKALLSNVGTAIHARSTGTGNVTVNAREVVAGHGSATAIRADGLGSSVSVTAGAVSAGRFGIYVRNTGTSGSASITATGDVTSSGTPIHAYSRSGAVNVNVAGVSGGTNAIIAKNNGGSGTIAVTSTGTVSGNGTAIMVENAGSGSVTVIASSPVQGNGNEGINVANTNSAAGAGISITAAGAEGRRNAVRAVNASNGQTSVSLNGRVIGIRSSAIHVETSQSGDINVAVAGTVQGGANGAGIDTITNGGTTNITLARGAVVSAGTGIAIRNDEGNSNLVVNRGATLSGTAQFGGGVDSVVLAGGNIGTSILDGGEDTAANDTSIDVLTINGGSVTFRTNQFVNWERFELGTSGELRANGEVALRTENISIKGNLTMRDGVADDALTLNGNVDGGGTIHVDADFFVGNSDVVDITGNVTGTTSIVMNDISTSVGGNDRVPMAIVTVTGTVAESAFSLVNAGSNSGPNRYELTYDSNSKSFLVTKKESVGSLMLVAAPVSLFDTFARAPSLQQRHADRDVNNSWVRMIGIGRDYGDAAGEKAQYESDTTGIQMGYDLIRSSGPSGLWIFGVTAQFNEVRTDVSAVSSNGTLKATGYGVGGTATWYGDDGGYIDLQTQINLVDSDFKTGNLGSLMNEVNSTALLLSFETGKAFQVSENLTATPNVQLSWGRVGTTDFSTSQRQPVRFGNDGGLTGRLGLGLKYSEDDYSIHFLGNLYYDTMDSWDVNFGDKNYTDSKSAISGEFGIGGSMAVTETSTAYIRAEYQTSFGEGFEHRKATKLSAGMRWSW